jgi:hypothetical protein
MARLQSITQDRTRGAFFIAPSSKRDNAYFLRRIEVEYPAHFLDYRSGKYRSVAELRRATSLISPRTALHELTNAWRKASAAQRDTFLLSVGIGSAPGAAALSSIAPPIAIGRRLEPWAKDLIKKIMTARRMRPGDLAVELGLKRLNASVGNALKGKSRLDATTIAALKGWLDANAAVPW